jgi:hypothetical protein
MTFPMGGKVIAALKKQKPERPKLHKSLGGSGF